MRKDIQINTNTGDVVFQNFNNNNTYPFQWTSESDLYLLGEITLPFGYDTNEIQTEGVRIIIPYTPIYKQIKIKIVRRIDEENQIVLTNPVNGSEWYDVRTILWNKLDIKLRASQLQMISNDIFTIQLNTKYGIAYIWSRYKSDVININANIQNRNLLLKCIPSNCYRYPTSGVGLVRYLHANISRTD